MRRRDMIKVSGLGAIAGLPIASPKRAQGAPASNVDLHNALSFDDFCYRERLREAHERWVGSAFLKGLASMDDERAMALCLDNQQRYNDFRRARADQIAQPRIAFDDIYNERFANLSLDIISNAMRRLFEHGWITVRPMTSLLELSHMPSHESKEGIRVDSHSLFPEAHELGSAWDDAKTDRQLIDEYSRALFELMMQTVFPNPWTYISLMDVLEANNKCKPDELVNMLINWRDFYRRDDEAVEGKYAVMLEDRYDDSVRNDLIRRGFQVHLISEDHMARRCPDAQLGKSIVVVAKLTCICICPYFPIEMRQEHDARKLFFKIPFQRAFLGPDESYTLVVDHG